MRTRALTTRAVALRIGLAVALGIATTCAAAWGPAMLSRPRVSRQWDQGYGFNQPPRESISVPPPLRPWVPAAWAKRDSANLQGAMLASGWSDEGWGFRFDAIEMKEEWGPVPMPAHETSVWVLRAGWPLPSLACTAIARHASTVDLRPRIPLAWRGGIRVPDALLRYPIINIGERRRLPCIPLWPGFAANAGLVSGPLLMLWMFPPVLRASRRSRGRCPGCGYDRRGARTPVCPECGEDATARRRYRR